MTLPPDPRDDEFAIRTRGVFAQDQLQARAEQLAAAAKAGHTEHFTETDWKLLTLSEQHSADHDRRRRQRQLIAAIAAAFILMTVTAILTSTL